MNTYRPLSHCRRNMIKSIDKCLVAVCFGLSAVAVEAQDPSRSGKADVQRAQLSRLTEWFLSTGSWQEDSQLYVRELGNGQEVIVMLHGGWGGEHSGLVEAVKDLKDRYRFIFYDQRGSLRSPSPEPLITFDRHIEDLELLRRELKVDRLTLVGHSMGAVLASAYAAKYPARIKQLVLLAPAYLKNPIPAEDKELQHEGYVASQAFLNRPEVVQELEKYDLNRTDPPLSSQEETARFRINFARRMLSDIRNWQHMIGGRALFNARVDELTSKTYPESGWDYVREFKSRAYPVAIILGDRDFLDFGNGLMKKWVDGIPKISLSIIKDAGHLIWLDQPETLTRELLRHLQKWSPEAGSSIRQP
jgi:proline iminopeptidase